MARPRVAIVGNRKVSAYGRGITTKLAGELAKQGIAIISGLALGVDSLAHQAALDASGVTLAVLPVTRLKQTRNDAIQSNPHHAGDYGQNPLSRRQPMVVVGLVNSSVY